jgi:hypothetical protein
MSVPSKPSGEAPPTTARDVALGHLAAFEQRGLGACLRRIRAWPSLQPSARADLVAELSQELTVDCLENAEELATLGEDGCFRRFAAAVHRHHYRLCVRDQRLRIPADRAPEPRVPPPSAAVAEHLEDGLVPRLMRGASHLRNGRLCARSTQSALGVGRRTLQAMLQKVADAGGLDHDHVEFWRRRLVEALCMIAAARLRADGTVRLWEDRARRDFHAEAFRARLARIRESLVARPLDPDLRAVLQTCTAKGDDVCGLPPRALLDLAERLDPTDPTLLSWRFELEIADGDLGAASLCLTALRHRDTDRRRLTLARARLLEARGRVDAARALVRRASSRCRGTDPRLIACADALGPRTRSAASTRTPPDARNSLRTVG